MVVTPLSDSTYCISLNDRTTDLFEGLWPISKEGVTYNSYIIKDEKKVIIDLAKAF
ncbi:MAG: FprA family A-type flavoprotein, partial [Spirochaetales bacterium]